jgi:hypothetical protein
MKQHIAKFFLDVLHIVANERVGKFEHFFDRIRAKAFVGLFSVPRTFYA